MRSLNVLVNFKGSLDELAARISGVVGGAPVDRDPETRVWTDSHNSYTLVANPLENDLDIDFERYEYLLVFRTVRDDEEAAAREAFRRLTALGLPIMLVDDIAVVLEQHEPVEVSESPVP